jgi:integrase
LPLNYGKIYNEVLIFNEMEKHGFIKKNPVRGYKIKKGKESRQMLSVSKKTLNILESAKIERKTMQCALDLFIFQCHTGVSYKDLTSLAYDNIDKDNWLNGRRGKTNVQYIVPLDNIALGLIKKYRKEIVTNVMSLLKCRIRPA